MRDFSRRVQVNACNGKEDAKIWLRSAATAKAQHAPGEMLKILLMQ